VRYYRVFLGVGLAVLAGVAAYLLLLGYGLLGGGAVVKVKDVPAGDQELAFLLPATAGDTWERFVAALDVLEQDWRGPGRLHVNKQGAFVTLTADVPEVALGLDGPNGPRLWVRWYKLSSEADAERWVEELAARPRPPLAVVGGDSSRTALQLALQLQARRGRWRGPDPLLLVTTATADGFADDQADLADDRDDASLPGYRRLLGVYPGRSFRYAFTNSRMAEVVLDFVDDNHWLWPPLPRGRGNAEALAWATALTTGPGGVLALPPVLGRMRQPILHAVRWDDDSYSVDLARRFSRAFVRQMRRTPVNENFQDIQLYRVTYSAGDNFLPNEKERLTTREFNEYNLNHKDQLQLVALTTSAQRAQRWLRTVEPRLTQSRRRNLVVVSGDAISFNNIYRDRRITWNPEDLHVSLVLFAHRNPVDAAAGFRRQQADEPSASSTGTDDLLLHRDVLESVLLAAHQDGRLLDADAALGRLRRVSWLGTRVGPPGAGAPLFDDAGERHPGTGEHVLWLRSGDDLPGPVWDTSVGWLSEWLRSGAVGALYEWPGVDHQPRPSLSVWRWAGGDWLQPQEELWLK
jgi:hypothetical protein